MHKSFLITGETVSYKKTCAYDNTGNFNCAYNFRYSTSALTSTLASLIMRLIATLCIPADKMSR